MTAFPKSTPSLPPIIGHVTYSPDYKSTPSTMRMGRAYAYGVHPLKPIINIPKDALKVKIRMRVGALVMGYVKFKDRIECWAVMPADEVTVNHPQWKLGILRGVNYSK